MERLNGGRKKEEKEGEEEEVEEEEDKDEDEGEDEKEEAGIRRRDFPAVIKGRLKFGAVGAGVIVDVIVVDQLLLLFFLA